MKILRIKLDEAGEAALKKEKLKLGDLAWLLAFGDRRETAEGIEISLDPNDLAETLGPRTAARMRRLNGIVLLMVEGRITQCRRIIGEEPNEEGKEDVSIE